MNAHIKHLIIGPTDDPQYVVVPYLDYLRLTEDTKEETFIPHEVVELHIIDRLPMLRAWRVFKKMTQKEVAEKAGITQAAYSQMEKSTSKPHAATLDKIAAALGISVEHLIV